MNHKLKVHPQFWDALASRDKNFEVRRNDRKFAVGDVLELRKYDPAFGYSGDSVFRKVLYILHHEDLPNGLQPGYVALGLGN